MISNGASRQQDPFPPLKASVHYRSGEEAFVGMNFNEQGAPIAVIAISRSITVTRPFPRLGLLFVYSSEGQMRNPLIGPVHYPP